MWLLRYCATALYLTGVSALVIHNTTAWITLFPLWLTVLIATIFRPRALAFVWGQRSMKSLASAIRAACDLLRAQWLPQFPHNLDLSSPVYADVVMPTFLHDVMPQTQQRKTIHLPKWLTLAAIWGWGFFVLRGWSRITPA